MNKVKQRITYVVLFAVLGILSASCEKEETTDSTDAVISTYSAIYMVEGQRFYANPQTEEEWLAFYEQMVALVEEGYTVHFWRNGVQASCSKEKVTFTTTSHAEAVAWCKQKADEGYTVAMTFNQQTGQYTCIAVR